MGFLLVRETKLIFVKNEKHNGIKKIVIQSILLRSLAKFLNLITILMT